MTLRWACPLLPKSDAYSQGSAASLRAITRLVHRSKPHRYFDHSSAICLRCMGHVEAERAASRSDALTHKEMRYGDIGRSEVCGKSVLDALRMLKDTVDTIA